MVKDSAIECLHTESDSILGLIPQLDDKFTQAVSLIYKCQGKIIVTGVGKSGHIGNKIAATFSSTGTPAFFVNPLDAYHGDLGVISSPDVVIAISYSGNTDELLRFIPIVLHEQVPIIGITGNPNSMLAKYSTCHLSVKVEKEACPLGLAPTSSTTATLALGDALAVALMKVRDFKSRDFALYHPGGSLGKRLLTTAADVMHRDNLPEISPELSLSKAIILISKAKLGLAAVCDPDGRVIGIITDGDVRRAMENNKERFFVTKSKEIMNTNPKLVSPDTKLTNIHQLMLDHKIHSVLVVDADRHLLGVVDYYSCMV